jgi:hypothetical protein
LQSKFEQFSDLGYLALGSTSPIIYTTYPIANSIRSKLCFPDSSVRLGEYQTHRHDEFDANRSANQVCFELLFGLLFAVALIVKHHSELDAAMKRDIELGYTPLIVFAAVGSGHRDDIASLRTACTTNGAWLHVEG